MSALVLVVQHDLLLREVISEILDASGHKTVIANDAYEAMVFLEANSFDLFLTCPHPEPVNGVVLAIEAKDLCPKLPIILIGVGFTRDASLPFLAAIVRSPFTEAELHRVIEKTLQEARTP